MGLILFMVLASPAFAADLPAPSKNLYSGWLMMYDRRFDEAHQAFGEWKQTHSADALGPASEAAAYLFAELARLGVLESELFVENTHYSNRATLQPDPQMKTNFNCE